MSELVTDEIVERIARRRYEDHVRIDKYPQNWPTWEDFHGVFKEAVYAGARSEVEAIAPLIAGQALEGVTEVFEIVDRHTNRRLEVSMYLTSNEAFAVVATWPADSQRIARVQSVAVAHG